MKKILTLATVSLITVLSAESLVFQDSFNDASKWFKNGKNGNFKFVDGGKEGKCLHSVTENYIFMFNLKKNLPMKQGRNVKISLAAKGKGSVSLNPMGRGEPHGTAYLTGKSFKVDSNKWQTMEHTFTFADKKVDIKNLALRINIDKNSSVMIDDLKITVSDK